MSKLNIAVIILTYNEEIHIRRCVDNVKDLAKEIFVVDSFSTDKTCEIAQSLGAIVHQNKWENNYAKQFNWAIDNLPISAEWILRLDADEYLSFDLKEELRRTIPYIESAVTGVNLPLRRVFLGREIKHGMGSIQLLRIFRYGFGRSENRMMDEHIELFEGKSVGMRNVFSDDNLNNLSWWTLKHVNYAIREAVDLINLELNLYEPENKANIRDQALNKRKQKNVYNKLPLFFRSFSYFIYRYIFKFGFLDGKEGFLWHFLQAYWYRTFVDAKIFEIKKTCGNDKQKIIDYISKTYNIKF